LANLKLKDIRSGAPRATLAKRRHDHEVQNDESGSACSSGAKVQIFILELLCKFAGPCVLASVNQSMAASLTSGPQSDDLQGGIDSASHNRSGLQLFPAVVL
jgi:hypothetical protein